MPDISRSRQLRQGARRWLDVAKSQEIHGLLQDALGGGNARGDGIVSVAASLFQSLKSSRIPRLVPSGVWTPRTWSHSNRFHRISRKRGEMQRR